MSSLEQSNKGMPTNKKKEDFYCSSLPQTLDSRAAAQQTPPQSQNTPNMIICHRALEFPREGFICTLCHTLFGCRISRMTCPADRSESRRESCRTLRFTISAMSLPSVRFCFSSLRHSFLHCALFTRLSWGLVFFPDSWASTCCVVVDPAALPYLCRLVCARSLATIGEP